MPDSQKSNFYKERDNAVYNAYLNIMKQSTSTYDTEEVIKKVAAAPQTRIWVPARTVYNILRRYVKHKLHPSEFKKPLIRDVIAAYNRIKNKRDYQGKSLYFIADFVTAEPANGFYLSRRRLFDIIRHRRKENFRLRCESALTGLQSYERQTLLYGLKP